MSLTKSVCFSMTWNSVNSTPPDWVTFIVQQSIVFLLSPIAISLNGTFFTEKYGELYEGGL